VKSKANFARRQSSIEQRLDPKWQPERAEPVLEGGNVRYEVSGPLEAIGCGGVGMLQTVIEAAGLGEAIDERVHLLKRHLPYHESDHVLSQALIPLTGGHCLEDLVLLLLCHQPRDGRDDPGRGGAGEPRTLPPGEPHRADQERGPRDPHAGGRVRRQLVLPGHRLPGLEPQGLDGPPAAPRARRPIHPAHGVPPLPPLHEIVLLPAQILRTGRQLVFRLLAVNRWVPLLLDGTHRLKLHGLA